MTTSQSLNVGRSYLPGRFTDVPSFIEKAAGAIESNPEVAAEITLAATHTLLNRFKVPADLRKALSALVSKSCKARDQSVQ